MFSLVVTCLSALIGTKANLLAPAEAFAKPTDLDVASIEREPRYPVYIIGYDTGVPYVAIAPQGEKTWPDEGEIVSFNAHVVNKGDVPFSGFDYEWRFYMNDGPPVWQSTGRYSSRVAPGEAVVVSQSWPWYAGIPGGPDHRTHKFPKLVLTITPDQHDQRLANNVRDYYPLGKDVAFWVGQDMYDAFNARPNALGTYSYEDWVQYQFAAMNDAFGRSTYPLLAPDGILERVNLEAVYVVPAASEANGWKCPGAYQAEPIYRERTFRGGWDQPRPGGSCSMNDQGSVDWLDDVIGNVDDGLVHELSHQLGLADSYNLHAGRWDWPCPGLMGGGDRSPHCGRNTDMSDFYSSQDAVALNLEMPFRARYFGEYLFDVPKSIKLLFRARDGEPLRDAFVEVYAGGDRLTQRGVTGPDGVLELDNRPISDCVIADEWCKELNMPRQLLDGQRRNPTLTGHSQHDSPFGQIDVTGKGGVLKFRVEALNRTWDSDGALEDRLSIDLSDANIAYWLGNTESATFELRTNLRNGESSAASR